MNVEDRHDAPKPSPQRRSEPLDETPGGDDRGQIGPRPALTISEAAQAAGVDRRTVRRRLDSGPFEHAWREDGGEGPWRIPVDDLIGAGLRLHAPATPAPSAPQDTAQGQVTPPPTPAPDPDELAEWRTRALVAESVCQERERTIAALELALRALEPGPPVTTLAPTPSSTAAAGITPESAPSRDRPGWWRRLRGG